MLTLSARDKFVHIFSRYYDAVSEGDNDVVAEKLADLLTKKFRQWYIDDPESALERLDEFVQLREAQKKIEVEKLLKREQQERIKVEAEYRREKAEAQVRRRRAVNEFREDRSDYRYI